MQYMHWPAQRGAPAGTYVFALLEGIFFGALVQHGVTIYGYCLMGVPGDGHLLHNTLQPGQKTFDAHCGT